MLSFQSLEFEFPREPTRSPNSELRAGQNFGRVRLVFFDPRTLVWLLMLDRSSRAALPAFLPITEWVVSVDLEPEVFSSMGSRLGLFRSVI